MSDQYTFARFWRCALQVNPVSYNSAYRGNEHGMSETDYNQALLEKCKALDIKVIGLADHGSVDSVDTLRNTLAPHGIVVFPGFEIASNDKTHFVCLFSEKTTSQQLERYLGKLDLLDPADGVCPSGLSSEHLIDKVEELGGFIYAAHCTQDSGLLKNRQNHVWQKPNLRAAQIPASIDDLKGVENDFYRKVILNKNDNYRRERPMAIINAKDVARPDDLENGGATCLIKMTRPTFAAFKVAFLDPGSRIRLNSQQSKSPVGGVLSLAVSGGYLDGVEVNFSEHLNAVIGGRGTGKSTLLECLRYVMEITPKGIQAQKSHLEVIKENLGRSSGRVEISIMSSEQNGRKYLVSRRFGEPAIVRDSEGNVSTLHPRDLLPGIDIYGQNEIYELAQDESSRLKLLDRFLPENDNFSDRSARICKDLQQNQQSLAKSLSDYDDLKAEVGRLPKLEEQVQGFQALGIQEKLAKTSLLARERQIEQRSTEEVQHLRDSLHSLRDNNLPDLTFVNDTAIEDLPDADQLRPIQKSLERLQQSFAKHLEAMQVELSEVDQQLKAQFSLWQQSMQHHEADLEKALRSLPAMAGKSGQEVGTAYQRLMQDIERINPKKSQLSRFETQIDTLRQERRNLLAELSDLRSERVQALQKAAKRLNRRLLGKLKVEIIAEADRTPLKRFLLDCRLEGIGEKRLGWIDELETLNPISLSKDVQKGATTLQEEWGLTPVMAEALSKLQPSQTMALEALELGHRVDIFLNVAHGQAEPVFRALNRLSTGQQCTAILHMLLLENADPLIMDQPEDNLDNAFIADRIVAELRDAKTSRQFLFATHNANIPVFGDAEWIGVFTALGNQGSLGFEAQGSIDVPVIRDQVASILEGGRDAFIQRKEKYEF